MRKEKPNDSIKYKHLENFTLWLEEYWLKVFVKLTIGEPEALPLLRALVVF